MEIDLSSVKFSSKESNQEEEFDIVENGIFKGTQSTFEFVLNNAFEVCRRLHLIFKHMDQYEEDNKEIEDVVNSFENELKDLSDSIHEYNDPNLISKRKSIKKKMNRMSSSMVKWERSIKIPNDHLTKILLGTIDLNWGTRKFFNKLKDIHNHHMRNLGVFNHELEDKINSILDKADKVVDDL